MPGDKITREDLFGDGLFPQKEIEAYETAVNALIIANTELIKTNLKIAETNLIKNAKDVRELNKAIIEGTRATEAKLKAETQREKLNLAAIKRDQAQFRSEQLRTKEIEKKNKVIEKENSAYQKLSKQLLDQKKRVKDLLSAEKQLTDEDKKLIAETQKLDEKLKKIDKTVGDNQRNVGNYESALSSLSPLFGRVSQSVSGFGAALKKLAKNPVLLTITAIVASISGLVAILKTTDKGATSFAGTMKGLSNAMDVLRIRLVGVVTGTMSLKNAFTGLGDELSKAFQAGIEYENQLDRLSDAETAYISQKAINANKVAKLDFIAKDTTKSIEERINALQKLIDIELMEAKEEEKISKERYEAELNLLAATKGIEKEKLRAFIESSEARDGFQDKNNFTDEEIKALEESFAKTKEADTNFFEETKKANAKLQALRKEDLDDKLKTYDINRQTELDNLRSQEDTGKRNISQLDKLNDELTKKISNGGIFSFVFSIDDIKKRKKAVELMKKQAEEQRKIQEEILIAQAEDEEIKATNSIENEEERAAAIKKIRNKLALDIMNLNNETAISEKNTNKKIEMDERAIFSSRLKAGQDFARNILEQVDERRQAEINMLDDQISQREKNIEEQLRLAELGSDNELAFQRQKLAEEELAKKEQQKKAQRQEQALKLADTFLNSLNSKLEKDIPYGRAASEAFAETFAAKGLSSLIAGSFIEGTEKVSDDLKGNKAHNGKDGYVVAVDGDERIINPKQNKLLGDISNDELIRRALLPNYALPTGRNIDTAAGMSNSLMLHKLHSIDKKLSMLEQIADKPVSSFELTNLGEVIEKQVYKGVESRFKYQRQTRSGLKG